MATLKDTFIEQIRNYREAQGLTQQQLGDKLSVSRITIVRWETGERTPDLDSVEKIANALNKKVSLIFDHEELPSDEKKLLFIYRALNADGKKYILECAENASEVSRYKSEQKEALA